MSTPRNGAAVVLPAVAGLDAEVTLFGGQAFRWRRVEDARPARAAEGWIGDRPVVARVFDDTLEVEPLDGRIDGLEAAAARYFDAARDYAAVERRLDRDPRLRGAASGVRILRQPAFETLVSFVVSANNNIPRIARAVELLSALAGRAVAVVGETRCETRFAFPEPEALAALDAATLRRDANLGYRDRYVAETSRLVASGTVDLGALDALPTGALLASLTSLPGVGPKVADCVALFGYGRLEVFPVDTWVRRAYAGLYLDGEAATDRRIRELAVARFGRIAGVAQQALFEATRRAARAGR